MVLERFVAKIVHSVIRYDYRESGLRFGDDITVRTETAGALVGVRIAQSSGRYWYPHNGNLMEIIWDTAKDTVKIYAHSARLLSPARDEFQRCIPGCRVAAYGGRDTFHDQPILKKKKQEP